jgi:predicted RNase H-like HicB family nuclease
MTTYVAYLRKDQNSDYGVEFPGLPGCFSAGRTMEEAKAMAAEALAGHASFLES